MRYHFPLAPVLRVRSIVAERQERLLANIQAEIAQVRNSIERVDLEIVRTAQIREQGLTAAIRAVHLQASYVCVHDLREGRRRLEERLRTLENARVEQQSLCEAAYRDREVVTQLKDTHRTAWQAERDKLEQKLADDAFLRRFMQ